MRTSDTTRASMAAVPTSTPPTTEAAEPAQEPARRLLCRRNIIVVLLVTQITLSALLMRFSRTHRAADAVGPMYRATVAVLATEALKLPVCLLLTLLAVGGPRQALDLLLQELPTSTTLKCAAPALAYTLQGNLLFFATANLETPTFQVTYQTKTLFTAVFSVVLLGRRLVASQWVALLLLFVGTVLASDLSGGGGGGKGNSRPRLGAHEQPAWSAAHEQPVLGLGAVLVAALLSSSSSVYFEAMLKTEPKGAEDEGRAVPPAARADAALWLRNIQLSMFALPLAAAAAALQDGRHIRRYGLLQGFDEVVWLVVVVNGAGGLLVAATMKYMPYTCASSCVWHVHPHVYGMRILMCMACAWHVCMHRYADNIVKCFATALAILSGTLLSVPMFGFQVEPLFAAGAACTVVASILYAWAPNVGASALSEVPARGRHNSELPRAGGGGGGGGGVGVLPEKEELLPPPRRPASPASSNE